jgi:hypothetical protein
MLHRHGLVADFFDLIDAVGLGKSAAGGVIPDEIAGWKTLDLDARTHSLFRH